MTRPGIAEVCALHLPNVSRTMRELVTDGLVSEHTRAIRGEERRQKTWQLTDEGRLESRKRIEKLRSTNVLIRNKKGKLFIKMITDCWNDNSNLHSARQTHITQKFVLETLLEISSNSDNNKIKKLSKEYKKNK